MIATRHTLIRNQNFVAVKQAKLVIHSNNSKRSNDTYFQVTSQEMILL